MTWRQRYHLRRAVRWSLWLQPALAVAAAFAVSPLIRMLDRTTGWAWFSFSPNGARTVLGAFTSSTLTFVVFVISSLLIVVQLASAQLTPRIIARVLADDRLKWVLSVFTFTYAYTIGVSGRIEETTPQLPVFFAIICNLACIAILFWFVQWLAGSLRPTAVLQSVAEQGRAVVESVYPEPFDPDKKEPDWNLGPEREAKAVEYLGTSGVVLAFSQSNLVAIAERSGAVIEMIPEVGDFVAQGDALFYVRNGDVDPDLLRECIAIGNERTMTQDPRFAFRIMVDIANKALSPAINDPTTAVLALDQIHHLLLHIGMRNLEEGHKLDAKGVVRLCYGTPDWIDFVCLAITEIRHFGASSMQVARRLQAMIEHLIRVLPEARKPPLQHELHLLKRAIERDFPDEEDRALAQIGDYQGIGSSESD